MATVGRPVARAYEPARIVEVTRLCTRRDFHPSVVRHAASMLYGAAAREAKRRRFERILTYTLDQEHGVSLVAAGWELEARIPGQELEHAQPATDRQRSHWTQEALEQGSTPTAQKRPPRPPSRSSTPAYSNAPIPRSSPRHDRLVATKHALLAPQHPSAGFAGRPRSHCLIEPKRLSSLF